jgi:hypothetical protein
MTIDDIKHLFKPQIDEAVEHLQFIIVEGENETAMTHPSYDLEGLVPRLDGCTPAGHGPGKTMRFNK